VLLETTTEPQAALRAMIEACHTFIDWAEATLQVLEPRMEEA
jgi:hypothetical protein